MIKSFRSLGGEPRLFAAIALTQVLVVIAGFGLEPLRGRTDYGALPLTVYLHASIGLAWCTLAVVQPWLIGARQRELHRTLGWIGAVIAAALVVTGIWTTFGSIAGGRQSAPAFAIVTNVGGLIPFAVLVAVAIRVRRRTDWHRRLLTCATIVAVAPAWARIVPMEQLGPVGLLVMEAGMLAPVVWGAVHDRRTQRRVHPAWYWGAAAILSPLFMVPIAFAPGVVSWANGFAPAVKP